MKKVLLLGATGSIGGSAIKVITRHQDKFCLDTIIAKSNVEKVLEIVHALPVGNIGLHDESKYLELKSRLSHTRINVVVGEKDILDLVAQKFDVVISAIIGVAGLKPTYEAIKQADVLAIANKEAIVCAGPFMIQQAQNYNCKLIPIDSEHSAVFQSYEDLNKDSIHSISITSSGGGRFRNYSLEEMANITPEQAVLHTNWDMGAKITVDSATMANKGLEVLEAMHLFNLPPEKIKVIVHPEQIIHGMVTYDDGSSIAQLAVPDMVSPIAYALAHPSRLPMDHVRLDLSQYRTLNFYDVDYNKFPLLKLAYQIAECGLSEQILYNVANEIAVIAFLRRQIGFLDIYRVVSKSLEMSNSTDLVTICDVCTQIEEAKRISSIALNQVMN